MLAITIQLASFEFLRTRVLEPSSTFHDHKVDIGDLVRLMLEFKRYIIKCIWV